MKMRGRMVCFFMSLWMVFTFIPVTTSSAAYEGETLESVYEKGSEGETKYTPAVMPGSVTAFANVATARMTLQQLQDKFPDGKYWNGGDADSYTNFPCPSHATTTYCNCFTADGRSAWQCYGFALKLGYDAYGTSPRNWNYTTASSYVDSLKPGDIVDNSGNPYHTVFVIGVTDTDIIVGECNWGGRCLIKWGRSISKSDIRNYSSLKIYIAPSALTTTPAATPEISVSQSSVSLKSGQSTTLTVNIKNTSGRWYINPQVSTAGICSWSWGNLTGEAPIKQAPLTIAAGHAGTTNLTLYLKDKQTDAVLTSKTIKVTVATSGAQVSVETLNTLNSTGTASLYPTVFKGYLRGTSKYNAYSDSSGSNYIGRIYTTDELKVQSVYANNGTLWMSALCPWDGYASDRLIYAKLDAVVDTSFAPYTAIASSSATVYTRSNASAKYGSLGKGDAVTVVGQSGQYSQVIYPLAVGGYKIGWCATASLSRPDISSVTAVSSTSLRLAYTLPSNAANNLVILDAGMNVLLRGSIRGSGGTVTRLTPGVTYYIYIESELSNGTGTVTSMVKKVVLK